MGSCCSSEEVTLNNDSDAQLKHVKYVERQGPQDVTLSHSDQSTLQIRPLAKVPPQTSSPVGQAEYGLQPTLRYPGDASGLLYQPSGPGPLVGAEHMFAEDMASAAATTDPETQTGTSSLQQTAAMVAVTNVISAAEPELEHHPEPHLETHHKHQPKSFQGTHLEHYSEPPSKPQPQPQLESDSGAKPESEMVESGNGSSVKTVETVTSSAPERLTSVMYEPRDVMISYSRGDKDLMEKIKDALERQGMTVWVDETSIHAGADFLSKIGEAIIDAKLFVCILSEKAVKSKYCRDEVALAYVSNTAMFPVNLQPREQLLPFMDTGLKLQLANYNWTSLADSDNLSENIQDLVTTMKAELDDLDGPTDGSHPHSAPPDTPVTPPTPAHDGEEVTSPADVQVVVESTNESSSPVQSPSSDKSRPGFRTARRLRERNRVALTLHGDDISGMMADTLWSQQFGVSDYVMWDRFTAAFLKVFKEPVERTFSEEDQQQLMDILKRELEVDTDDRIYKYQLVAFCSASGEVSAVWPRVQEQARESFAMREVFSMDSSVRVEAIENLGKFRSAAVIDALRDLLTDPDANVRAVATISLSRTNADDPVTIRHILRTLSDKDRLVREAGCLALGHLKARQAIGKLSHLWRNDVISHVRDAAAVALHQIGGQEVEDTMRVTKVLAEEIRSLTESSQQ